MALNSFPPATRTGTQPVQSQVSRLSTQNRYQGCTARLQHGVAGIQPLMVPSSGGAMTAKTTLAAHTTRATTPFARRCVSPLASASHARSVLPASWLPAAVMMVVRMQHTPCALKPVHVNLCK
jgi:hypothetical protein